MRSDETANLLGVSRHSSTDVNTRRCGVLADKPEDDSGTGTLPLRADEAGAAFEHA